MQADRIGNHSGSNLYAYVGNDPLNFINPLSPYSPLGRVTFTLVDTVEAILADASPGVGVATVAVEGAILTAATTSTASPQQGKSQHAFFHGTTIPSALALLNGAPISVSAIQQMILNTGGDPRSILLRIPNLLHISAHFIQRQVQDRPLFNTR